MKKVVCSFLLAVWLFTLIPVAYAETSAVPEEPSSWAEETVQEAVMLGMVPEQLQSDWQRDLTRGEFAQLLVRFLSVQYGYGEGTGFRYETFIDDYLTIRSGRGGKQLKKSDLLPGDRSSWTSVLANPISFFSDVEKGTNCDREIDLAYLLGIVKGRDETHYDPAGAITRQEAAALLARTYETYGTLELSDGSSTPFTDSASIAPWAEESVAAMVSWDILRGDEDHAFLPHNHCTREQGVLAFMRLYKNMPISRYNSTLAPLLTQEEVVERCVAMGPFSGGNVQYRADTDLCTVLCITYGGVMHPPGPAIFLIYPDSTFKRIDLPTSTPQDFQLTNQETKCAFTDYLGIHYTLDLQSGTLYS